MADAENAKSPAITEHFVNDSVTMQNLLQEIDLIQKKLMTTTDKCKASVDIQDSGKQPSTVSQPIQEKSGGHVEVGLTADPQEEIVSKAKRSRSEKNARKALLKLGLKQVKGVRMVTIKRAQLLFIFSTPDVYKHPVCATYIVFGEAKVEDLTLKAQKEAAGKFTVPTYRIVYGKQPILNESEEDEEIDDTGLDDKDIELVMSQVNVSRSKAIKALRRNDNDIVNAIMNFI